MTSPYRAWRNRPAGDVGRACCSGIGLGAAALRALGRERS
jgi:hypothetical protein